MIQVVKKVVDVLAVCVIVNAGMSYIIESTWLAASLFIAAIVLILHSVFLDSL